MTFARFWAAYPRKHGKAAAEKSWKRAKLDDNEILMDHVIEQVEICKKLRQWQDKQFIPLPATWLNQRRWEDEHTPDEFLPAPRRETAKAAQEREDRERIQRRDARLSANAPVAPARSGPGPLAIGAPATDRLPEDGSGPTGQC